jgi:L-cysteine desulfidase
MCIDTETKEAYLSTLREELVTSVGCTEPACLALAGAKLREILGAVPEAVVIKLSANLIKNTKSVLIPYSQGLKGIRAAVWLGILGGDSQRGLAALSSVNAQAIARTRELLSDPGACQVELLRTPERLHLVLAGRAADQSALVEIRGTHTNFVRLERNGEVHLEEAAAQVETELASGQAALSVQEILTFAECVDPRDLEPILRPQIEHNIAIAERGLEGDYGANIGRTLLEHFGTDVHNLARAHAAAASDARMGGCQMPVVINSGSGNQGITASIPVIVYARHLGVSKEKLLRALCVSNLIAIHQKRGIGRLSAYCGAVSAACAAGAALTYLEGGDVEQISATITNTLANVAGMICDGAKTSCAAKIASAVDAAILGHTMALSNVSFPGGDGIVKTNVEETIDVVRDIASEGMRATDLTIIKHMISS